MSLEARAICYLSDPPILSDEQQAREDMYVCGEVSIEKQIDEIKKSYRRKTTMENNMEMLDEMQRAAIVRRQRLFDAGALITERQLREALDMSFQRLEQAISEHRMFYVDGPGGERWFPSFFVDSQIRGVVERVSIVLGDLVGEVKFQFFMMPKYSISKRLPIVAINEWSQVDSVIRAAEEFRERSLGR